jgi:hypothetical protein
MRKPAARFICRSRVNRRVTHLNKRNFAVCIHNISHTVGHTVRTQNAIGLCSGTIFEIAEEGEGKLQLLGEDFLGGTVVGAETENLCIFTFKFCDTSLVRGEFLRSTTGECGGEKRQHHGVFAFEIGQRDFAAHRSRERKVRRNVPNLERCGVACLLSRESRAGGKREGGYGRKLHGQ